MSSENAMQLDILRERERPYSPKELEDVAALYGLPQTSLAAPDLIRGLANDQQSQRWVYTVFGSSIDDAGADTVIIPDDHVRFRIQGLEICPTTGRKHLQCYVEFHRNVRWVKFRKDYPLVSWFHVANGTGRQNFVYCAKELRFRCVGKVPKPRPEKDTTFAEALNKPTAKEALAHIREHRPEKWWDNSEKYERLARKHWKKPVKGKYAASAFNVPLQVLDMPWLFVGHAHMGKTQYALAHFKHPLFVTDIETLQQLDVEEHDGIVFDDIDFSNLPPGQVLALLARPGTPPAQLRCRYFNAEVPSEIPKIFCWNEGSQPFYKDGCPIGQILAILDRYKVFQVKNQLY